MHDPIAEHQSTFDAPHLYPSLVRRPTALVRLWSQPAFETWASWSIHARAPHVGEVWLRRVTVGPVANGDQARTLSFATELRLDHEPSTQNLLAELLDQLQGLTVPVYVPPPGLGLDGVTHGVESGTYMVRSALRWWGDGPEPFSELSAWHRSTCARLDALLPQWSARPWRAPP